MSILTTLTKREHIKNEDLQKTPHLPVFSRVGETGADILGTVSVFAVMIWSNKITFDL